MVLCCHLYVFVHLCSQSGPEVPEGVSSNVVSSVVSCDVAEHLCVTLD